MKFSIHKIFPFYLKDSWNQLLNESITDVPFLKYDYLKHWWETRGGGEWPEDSDLAIVTAADDEKLIGIAPLFLHHEKQLTTLYLLGSKEICDYLDVIVRPYDLDLFINNLLNFVSKPPFPHWDKLICHNLTNSSPTIRALEIGAEKAGWKFTTECVKHTPFINLPGNWETYLDSIDRKQRHEIRRKMRRTLENTDVKWYIVDQESTLQNEIDAFLRLMAMDENKTRFLTETMRDQMRRTITWAFKENLLQLSFLEILQEKAASYLCFDYQNRILVYNSGFDPRFSEYSPGWVLLANLLQWANENRRSEFDFMRGDEDYKYRFGAKDRFVICAIINR